MEKTQYKPTTQLRWNVVLTKVANKQKPSILDICPFSGFWDTGDSLTVLLLSSLLFLHPLSPSSSPTKWKERQGVKRWSKREGRCIPKIFKGYFLQGRISGFYTRALIKSSEKCQRQGDIADASWFFKTQIHPHLYSVLLLFLNSLQTMPSCFHGSWPVPPLSLVHHWRNFGFYKTSHFKL